MKKQPIYQRSKGTWTNEQDALNDVCEKQNTTADKLQAGHTEKQFVWKVIQADVATDQADVATDQPDVATGLSCKFSKEEYTESEAIAEAMATLNTFEGNLKTDHTETHYVFSKVRE